MDLIALALLAAAGAPQVSGLEVCFCPGDSARSYPLDTAHGQQAWRSNGPRPIQSGDIVIAQ